MPMTTIVHYPHGDCLETWIGDELVLVDLSRVWLETFAHWDQLVSTDLASRIATETERVLKESVYPPVLPGCRCSSCVRGEGS